MQARERNRIENSMNHRESGSVLVIALIMIVLLTIIGISASKTSEIEIMIAGNERVAKENFYLAEGAVRRAVMAMENADLKNDVLSWVYQDVDNSDTDVTYFDMETAATYSDPAGSVPEKELAASQTNTTFRGVESVIHEDENWKGADAQAYEIPNMGTDTRILAIKKGLAGKTSAKATGPLPYDFAVYGRSEHRNGLGLVVVGYRKAY